MEVIIITGANRGIGLALTKALLANENVVIAGCRRPDEPGELRQLTSSYPETLDLIKCDLEREEDLVAEADALRQRRGKLDVIINNAGIMPEEGGESILNIDLELFWQAFNTNVLGTARVVRAFYPLLVKSGRPRIINISSSLGSISIRKSTKGRGGPSEDYGNDEHTTVAAFLPWRGS